MLDVIHFMQKLKVDYLGNRNSRLHIDEMLVALFITVNTDSVVERATAKLLELIKCDVHSSVVLS